MAKAGTTGETNKAVVLRYVEEVWNEHDLDAIDGLASPDYLNHAARTAEYQRGGARRAVEWLLSVFPDHRFEVEDAAADGETVALRGTMAGTHEGALEGIAPTGKRVVAQQSHWFRVVDGKLAEHWAVRDDLSMLQQLGGVCPTRGSRGRPNLRRPAFIHRSAWKGYSQKLDCRFTVFSEVWRKQQWA